MKVYVASKLERVGEVHALNEAIRAEGHEITYDWTVHGPVFGRGPEGVRDVAILEAQGVADCDVLVALLPGGRGTHVEIGLALASGKRAILCAPPELFECGPGLCAFYMHPLVSRLAYPGSGWSKAIAQLVTLWSEATR